MKTISIEYTKERLQEINKLCIIHGFILKEIEEAIKQVDSPDCGQRCAFWDNKKEWYAVGTLGQTTFGFEKPYECREFARTIGWFKNCAPITQEAIF